MPRLTPYDTGHRAQPHVWPTGGGADDDAFGKVDFDNDESATVATVYLELDDETGSYVVHVSGDVTIQHTRE
jgi:hypothetical protein